MYVVREEDNVKGLPLPNKTRLVITDGFPDPPCITCSFVLAFQGEDLLLTHLRDRGWDIPGGHIELGEAPEVAAHRELYEETGACIENINFLGYEEIRLLGNKPDRYPYPFPNSYMVFYSAAIISMGEYKMNAESSGRALFNPQRAREIRWVQDHLELYEEALRRITITNRKADWK